MGPENFDSISSALNQCSQSLGYNAITTKYSDNVLNQDSQNLSEHCNPSSYFQSVVIVKEAETYFVNSLNSHEVFRIQKQNGGVEGP